MKQTQEKRILVENYRQGSIAPTKREISLLLTVTKTRNIAYPLDRVIARHHRVGDTVSVRLDDLISATMLFLIMFE